MNERIKHLRKMLNLSQDEFCSKLGYRSRGKITNIESGKIEPDKEFLDLVCRIFNVNYDWLINGIGSPFLPEEDERAGYISDLLEGRDDEFCNLVVGIMKTYSELDEKGKEVLRRFAKSLSENMKGRD